jgi:hypothetical protein
MKPSSPPVCAGASFPKRSNNRNTWGGKKLRRHIPESVAPFLTIMKQPTQNEQRKEDKKNSPAKGIDPEQKQPEMEADLNDQDPGERQKENQNQQKDDPLAA